jgi:phosphoribosylformylglycinamidine synthase subunit PurQ / glutaminase
MKPRVNVVYFPGTNCHRETISAFTKVGANARLVFAEDACDGKDRIDDADVICLPGGFSYGDHIRGGMVAAALLSLGLASQLEACKQKPLLCICNGFQIGVKAGFFGQGVTLAVNASGTFLHRSNQRHIVPEDHGTLWLAGLERQTLTFPCAHGEGRFFFTDRRGWHPALRYPSAENPDGSLEDIAGITDPTGRIFGLMDHPERAQHRDLNLTIFENGVKAVAT